jgi:hypothetical protein
MQRFKSPGHAQRFLSAFTPAGVPAIRDHFCPRRHRLKAETYRQERAQRFLVWNEIAGSNWQHKATAEARSCTRFQIYSATINDVDLNVTVPQSVHVSL